MAKEKGTKFFGPKSICKCGHTGDGDHSDHSNTHEPGHGFCKIKGCNCRKFIWKQYIKKYENFQATL